MKVYLVFGCSRDWIHVARGHGLTKDHTPETEEGEGVCMQIYKLTIKFLLANITITSLVLWGSK